MEKFFKFGKRKISEIVYSSNSNNIDLIETNDKFIYHVRNLYQEKESFNNPKWFVFTPEDLIVIFIFRIWQNFDFSKNSFGILNLDFYKKNILVDVYYIKEPLYFLKFNTACYENLENFISCIDIDYKISQNSNSADNQYKLSRWIEKNKNIINLDGWLEEKNVKNKGIDEIMIVSSSKNKLDLVYTSRISEIINIDNMFCWEDLKSIRNKSKFVSYILQK